MKKILLLSALSVAMVACQIEPGIDDKPRKDGVTVYLSGDKPATRTYYSEGNGILWSETGERLAVAISDRSHMVEDWEGGAVPNRVTMMSSNDGIVSDGGKTSTFSLSFEDEKSIPVGGTYRFHAIYPECASFCLGNLSMWDWGIWIGTRLDESGQYPPVGTFDPAADIMVGISRNEYDGITDDMAIDIVFDRLVTHGKITLAGLPTDATVVKAVITGPAGCGMSGIQYLNIMRKELTVDKSNRNYVVLNYVEADSKTKAVAAGRPVNADGSFDLWFCTKPVEIAPGENLKITLYTGTGVIQRSITANASGINFEKNKLSTLGINMGEQELKPYFYELRNTVDGEPVSVLSLPRTAGRYSFYITTNAGTSISSDISGFPNVASLEINADPVVLEDGSLRFACDVVMRENNSISNVAEVSIPLNFDCYGTKMYVDYLNIRQACGEGEIVNAADDWTADPIVIGSLKWYPVNLGFDRKHPYGKYFQFGRYAGQYPYCDDNSAKYAVPTYSLEHSFVGTPDDNTFYGYFENWYDLGSGSEDWPESTEENLARGKGNPCPEGWRLPTNEELKALAGQSRFMRYSSTLAGASFDGITSDGKVIVWYIGDSDNPLAVPLCGSIKAEVLDATGALKTTLDFNALDNVSLNRYGSSYNYGRYWAADNYYIGGSAMEFQDTSTAYRVDLNPGEGCSVRCVQSVSTE